MIKAIENRPILSLFICVVLMLGFSIQYLDVTIMEARNFITAREMLEDGNWLLTTMNGEPRYQKPPLPTWFAAIFGSIFGVKQVLALRFPGILMVAVLGITSYLFSYKFLNDKLHAFVNALILISSFYVIAIVIEAPWDIFAHGFMLIGIFNLYLLFEKKQNYWRNTLFAGIFIGLSILSKGPVSIYALLLPFILSYGFIFKFNDFKSKIFSVFSILILSLVIGGWWYLYVRFEDPTTFLDMTKTETSNWSSYNIRPFYYYWSFFVQSGIWTIPAFISLLYPFMKSRVKHLKSYQFSFFWTLLAVVLLSFIPEKKSRYLMPVLIPLAINIGFYIEYLIRKFRSSRDKTDTIPAYFSFGLIALIGISFPIVGFLFGPSLTGMALLWYILASISLVGIGVLMLINLKRKSIKNVFYLCAAFFISAFIFVLPLSNIQRNSNFNPISKLKNQTEKDNLKVYSLNTVSPELIWQFGDKIQPVKKNDSIYDLPPENTFGLLAKDVGQIEDKHISSIYDIKQLETFDLNNVDVDSKKHRARLRYRYYILTKK